MTDPVEASIRYVVAGERAVFYPADRERSYWPAEEHRMAIADMRSGAPDLALERNGFVLLREPSAVTDFYDTAQVRSVYYSEIAHVDYGERTVRQLTEDILGSEAAEHWLRRRFILMNLWRPIRTVYRTPLALCDASTVDASDLNDSEVRGGLDDPHRPPLFGFNLSYSPRYRWYYAPRMQPAEILAFKLFDSDRTRVQWTGHTAFDDPTASPDAPPRESIEIRTISFMAAER